MERRPGGYRTETEVPDLDLPAPVRRFALRVVAGRGDGERFVGVRERTVIGTDPAADLRLTDPTVSRQHWEVVLSEGKVLIRDLDSRNGTYVNGVPGG